MARYKKKFWGNWKYLQLEQEMEQLEAMLVL